MTVPVVTLGELRKMGDEHKKYIRDLIKDKREEWCDDIIERINQAVVNYHSDGKTHVLLNRGQELLAIRHSSNYSVGDIDIPMIKNAWDKAAQASIMRVLNESGGIRASLHDDGDDQAQIVRVELSWEL